MRGDRRGNLAAALRLIDNLTNAVAIRLHTLCHVAEIRAIDEGTFLPNDREEVLMLCDGLHTRYDKFPRKKFTAKPHNVG